MKHPLDFFTIYKQTAWNKDIDSMIVLYDNEVMIFDMWANCYQTGLVAWSGVIKDWLSTLLHGLMKLMDTREQCLINAQLLSDEILLAMITESCHVTCIAISDATDFY